MVQKEAKKHWVQVRICHESEGMERSMGRERFYRIDTMDKGRMKMARGY